MPQANCGDTGRRSRAAKSRFVWLREQFQCETALTPDGLIAIRTDGNESRFDAHKFLNPPNIAAGVLGQFLPARTGGDIFSPAGQLFVNRRYPGQSVGRLGRIKDSLP